MQFEQPLDNEALHFAESTMIPPVVDILNRLHEQFLAWFPARVDAELIFDRDRLRSQAFNALEQQLTGTLQPPGHRKVTGVVGRSRVRCQERELHSPIFIAGHTVSKACRGVYEVFPKVK